MDFYSIYIGLDKEKIEINNKNYPLLYEHLYDEFNTQKEFYFEDITKKLFNVIISFCIFNLN